MRYSFTTNYNGIEIGSCIRETEVENLVDFVYHVTDVVLETIGEEKAEEIEIMDRLRTVGILNFFFSYEAHPVFEIKLLDD